MDVGDFLWVVLAIFLFGAYSLILFTVIVYLQSHTTSVPAKVGWLLLLLFVPVLGIAIYALVHDPARDARWRSRLRKAPPTRLRGPRTLPPGHNEQMFRELPP